MYNLVTVVSFKFQESKDFVYNQTGKKINEMRSNNQGKYTSNDFDAFCRETRIKRELIMPYSYSRMRL